MAWPEQMAPLLGRPDWRAGQALRWGLRGLRASLQGALEEVAQDPGSDQLRGLLTELDRLLTPGEGTELPAAAAEGLPPPATNQPRLVPLARAIAADRRFQAELRRPPIHEFSDEVIWNEVQRLLLRLPPHLAEEGRLLCRQHAEQVGGQLDGSAAVALPAPRDEAIYPGLAGDVCAPGLCSSPVAPLDARLAPPTDESLLPLAGTVSTWVWFAEHDPHLHHALKSVFRFGMPPLTGEQRERYVAELLRLWERARATAAALQADSSRPRLKEHIRALLDLDEALQSLVYSPLAAPESWWGRRREQARQALFVARDRAVQAGCVVHLQLLGGTFADINRLAPDSLQVDFGVPGEVAACLRVWARIDGEEFKGRVLYRSPPEEA
jgi:hypothetical protein